MRLADFILANVDPILTAWDEFARSIWLSPLNDPATDPATLRDHAEVILRAVAAEMTSDQTVERQSAKSKGQGHDSATGVRVNRASVQHGSDRVGSGLDLWGLIAEYRALRASVIRLWRVSGPTPDLSDLDDLTRFNESIDQSLTEAVRSYSDTVARDREELLRKEQSARRDAESANRAKDLFLATLSHEMRTPLNAIVGWLTILRMPRIDKASLAEGLNVIERNTNAQVQLIDDLLDVARIVSGKLRLEIAPCNLVEVINAGIDVARPAADARGITLDVQLDPAAASAFCDATRIQQVVWNLLMNAIKFTHKRGTVRVTLDCERSFSRITVSDDGQGISPDLLPYVFDRFRQADSSTRRQFGGLGLGLSIVKHITEMHGGSIDAHSAGEGQGSTFVVRLPIKAVRVDEGGNALTSTSEEFDRGGEASGELSLVRLDGVRVLVVDDEVDARRMLTKVLEAVGAHVTTAANAAEALATLSAATANEDGPDILVSDVGMPGQDGYDLIREVRKRGHHSDDLPAVALTAFAQRDYAHEAARAGFQVHISKPVNVRDLTAKIASLIGLGG